MRSPFSIQAMNRIFSFTVLLLFFIPSWVQSDDKTPSSSGAWSLYIENDVIAGTDRDYTSGLKLSWTSRWIPAPKTESDDQDRKGWASSTLNLLPFFNKPGDRRALSISIGQTIYTPSNLERSDLILDDRPYAGYTYLGLAAHRTARKMMDTFELDIGVVGRHSYGEDVQEWVHRLLGSQEARVGRIN